MPLGLRRCEKTIGSRQFDRGNALARRAWVQNSRTHDRAAHQLSRSTQPEKAGDDENDDDDADDIENVHGVLPVEARAISA